MKITISKLREIIREVLTELDVIKARSAREKAEQRLAQAKLGGAEKDEEMKEIVAAMVNLDPVRNREEWKALRQKLVDLL